MNITEKKALLAEFEKFLDVQMENKITVRRETVIDTDKYEVGDIIDFTLTTGEKVSAMAMRQEEDGMLFVFIDCLKDEYSMNETNINEGGYEECDLRRKLNTVILSTFPGTLKDRMKPVYKEDKLRLLTATEVFGEDSEYDYKEDNGIQLEPMKERKNRIAFQGKGTDEWEWYWLQNTVKDSAADFASVYDSGDAYYDGASFAYGVRPAFKI